MQIRVIVPACGDSAPSSNGQEVIWATLNFVLFGSESDEYVDSTWVNTWGFSRKSQDTDSVMQV